MLQDLTTYQVFETTPILRVDEVTVGDGALCGSVYLNRRFEEMIQTKIGSQLNKLPKSEALEIIAEVGGSNFTPIRNANVNLDAESV